MSASDGADALASTVADELGAPRTGTTIEPPSRRHPGFTMADAYRVAELLRRGRLAAGAVAVGAKLGCTLEALWEGLGIDGPFWAAVYDDTVTDDREFSLDDLVAPRLEPEIVVGVGRALAPGADAGDVAESLAWAALGFELVQCRYPGWAAMPVDALADGGLHGRLVVGDRVALGPGQAARLSETAVALSCDGAPPLRGSGADAAGGPVRAVWWLLRLPGVEGLPAGSVVTTGTLTPPQVVAPGQRWRCEASGPVDLGALEVRFTGPAGGSVQSAL